MISPSKSNPREPLSSRRVIKCVLLAILCQSAGVSVIKAEKNYDVDPIATVTQGQLRGKFGESRNGKDYLEFLGIPYAVVSETFKPAVAPSKWEGIRDATNFGERCMQYDRNTDKVIGVENCLFLNIYRPMEMDKTLPVMVYIHGGAFMFGSGEDYGPQYFMDEEDSPVILVTINYRLGALGFLNTGDENFPGNLGMKDQVLALRWIRDNIASFGGSPGEVTLMGDSSGASSVSYHLLSPLSRGLFTAAISHSGCALCPWSFVANPKSVAKRLSFSVGCPTKNPRYLVACLMNKEPQEIVAAQHDLSGWDDDPIVPFAPSIEDSNKVLGTVFLPDHPLVIWESGNFNRVPWITGVNDAEGSTLYSAIILNSTDLTAEFNDNWNKIAPFALGYKEANPDSEFEATNDIRRYYFGNERIGLETRDNLTNMFSDRNFYQCNKDATLLHSRFAPVHLYYFTQRGPLSWIDIFKIPKGFGYHGVAHSDPLQFWFKLHNFPEITSDSDLYRFSQRVVRLWTSFAHSRKPSATWGDNVLEWNPMQLSELSGLSPVKYLQLEDNPKIIMEPFAERLDFWQSLSINLTNIHISPI